MKHLKKIIFFTTGIFLVFAGLSITKKPLQAEDISPWKQELEEIEWKIKQLLDQKRGYESRAIMHDNNGERLQFVQGELSTAKRHWAAAERNREIANVIGKEIDRLQEQKRQKVEDKYGKEHWEKHYKDQYWIDRESG